MRNFKLLILPFLYKPMFLRSENFDSYSKIYKEKQQYKLDASTVIFGGNSNKKLANDVANRLGVKLGGVVLERFADGECNIQILENVRGRNIFIIQSTSPPVNENLMELFLFVSALRRASAKSITVIVPYYGYSRQDHKLIKTESISSSDIARLLEESGIDHLVSIDLHRSQLQGAFSPQVPVDNLSPYSALIDHLNNNFFDLSPPNQLTLVSPDFNGISRAKRVQDELRVAFPNLKTKLAMIYKSKVAMKEPEMNLVGEVSGRNCLLVDDIVDSGSTLKNAAKYLKNEGANQIMAYATHPVLSGKASLTLGISQIDKIFLTDTIPIKDQDKCVMDNKLTILSMAPLIAETIYRLQKKQSLRELLNLNKS